MSGKAILITRGEWLSRGAHGSPNPSAGPGSEDRADRYRPSFADRFAGGEGRLLLGRSLGARPLRGPGIYPIRSASGCRKHASASRGQSSRRADSDHRGRLLQGSIPEGHDAVILANIVHCLSPEPVLELLRRTRDHVPGGARLLLVDFWTDLTHTQPPFAALMAGEFLLTPGGGDVYSVEEAREWLPKTGWRTLEHKPLAGPASLIVAETVKV